jgi:hypothetical protein
MAIEKIFETIFIYLFIHLFPPVMCCFSGIVKVCGNVDELYSIYSFVKILQHLNK